MVWWGAGEFMDQGQRTRGDQGRVSLSCVCGAVGAAVRVYDVGGHWMQLRRVCQ